MAATLATADDSQIHRPVSPPDVAARRLWAYLNQPFENFPLNRRRWNVHDLTALSRQPSNRSVGPSSNVRVEDPTPD